MQSKKILIDYKDNNAVRIAIIEDGVLTEIISEKKSESSIVGNIYAGVIKNILPNRFMFIDIGEKKNAFIFLNDNKERCLLDENNSHKIKTGDTILVQVVKDASGSKGACVTSKLAFTGMFFVMSKLDTKGINIGVSKKIDDQNERERLKGIIRRNLPCGGYDIIVRTRSIGKSEMELAKNLTELGELCKKAENEWVFYKPPIKVYDNGNLLEKALKELNFNNIDEIVVNDIRQFNHIENILGSEECEIRAEKLTLYKGIDLFEEYNVKGRLEKALMKKVWLKSGGFLVIEKTEACYVIDVNTGKFGGSKGYEESIFKVNLEAAVEIAAQIRLRNLSGIIIVDFIDMKQENNKEILMEQLENELKKDRIPNNLYGMTELGLVQITRKKQREPIDKILLS